MWESFSCFRPELAFSSSPSASLPMQQINWSYDYVDAHLAAPLRLWVKVVGHFCVTVSVWASPFLSAPTKERRASPIILLTCHIVCPCFSKTAQTHLFHFPQSNVFFFFLCGNWSPKRWTSIFPLHPINTCSHTPPRATPHLQSSVTGLALWTGFDKRMWRK